MRTLVVLAIIFIACVAASGNSDLYDDAAAALVKGLRRQDNLYINAEAYHWNVSQIASVVDKFVQSSWAGEYTFIYPLAGVFVVGEANLTAGFNLLWYFNAGERRTWDGPQFDVNCDNSLNCEINGVFVATARAKNPSTNKLSGIISQIGATVYARVVRNHRHQDFKLSYLSINQNSYLVLTANNTNPWLPATLGNDIILP